MYVMPNETALLQAEGRRLIEENYAKLSRN